MKNQRGEIATILTLVSVGLMLVGLVVGNVAVQQQTQTRSKAMEAPPEPTIALNLDNITCYRCNGSACEQNSFITCSGEWKSECPSSCSSPPSNTPPPAPTATTAPTSTAASTSPSAAATPTGVPGSCKAVGGTCSPNTCPGTSSVIGDCNLDGNTEWYCCKPSVGECQDLARNNPQVNCKYIVPGTCTPGTVKYQCITDKTCPYDNRVGVGYPLWCGKDNQSYMMNAAGECTWACQPPGQPSPTPDTAKCPTGSDGKIITDCIKTQCAPDPGRNNKTYWINISQVCQEKAVYERPGAFTNTECTLKSGYEVFSSCNPADASKVTPTLVEDKRIAANKTTPTPASACKLQNASTNPGLTQECVNCLWGQVPSATQKTKPGECSVNQYIYSACQDSVNRDKCNSLKTDLTKCGTATNKCNITPTPGSSNTGSGTVSAGCQLTNVTNLSSTCTACILKKDNWTASRTDSNGNFSGNGLREYIDKYRSTNNCSNDDLVKYWCNALGGTDESSNKDQCQTKYLNIAGTKDTGTGCKDDCKGSGSASTGTAGECTSFANDIVQYSCANCVNGKLSNKPDDKITNPSCNLSQKVISWCASNPGSCGNLVKGPVSECVNNNSCEIKNDGGGKDKYFLRVQSYTNTDYDEVIAAIKTGKINAIYASLYVLNATRVPGLQRQYCDPFQGQCDFYYQQNPQVGT